MEILDPNLTLMEELSKTASSLTVGALRSVLGGFLFSGDDVFKKVSVLSGGEKTRLLLCKIMMTAPNLLLLDEPTNHLDIPGRQMLEDALDNYEGTLVLISHDRHFINSLCDKVGVIEDGELVIHPGNFDDYQRLWLSNPAATLKQSTPSPLASPSGLASGLASGLINPVASPSSPTANNNNSDPPNLKNSNAASWPKANRQAEKRLSADERKARARERKNSERQLAEAEKRLDEIAGRAKEIESDLARGDTYRDGDKAKNLKLELDHLYAEKNRLEEVWQAAALEMES
jgi:ATP-binding cassette subfamily F protein 3